MFVYIDVLDSFHILYRECCYNSHCHDDDHRKEPHKCYLSIGETDADTLYPPLQVQTPPKTTTIYRKSPPNFLNPQSSPHLLSALKLNIHAVACASPISSPAYGVAQSFNANEGPITTTTYNLTTSDGSSALACCNKCFFESQNCVRALYNSPNSIVTSNPMGCIVSTAPQAVGDNVDAHRTGSCPAGVINGLYYTPSDGSQIHIAGPCGYLYENL